MKIKGLSAVVLLMIALCFCSCSKDGMTGREYQGDYHPIEWISLEFGTNSKVVGEISSTDFVGHFTDHVYGHYEYKHPSITIVWEKVDADNDVYKSVISNPDSIIVNESLDTLRLWEGNEEYVLPKYRLFKIDDNASFLEQIGQYCGQSIILIIVFIIRHFFSIVIAVIILVLLMKWWKKRRK